MLFLINLSMDFLTVYIAARLTHAGASLPRQLAAAAVGALYGVLAVILIKNDVLSVLCNVAISATISGIAFGFDGGLIGLLRQSAIVWGCGALLGGIMSAFMTLGEPAYLDDGRSRPYSAYYILTFAAAVLLIRLLSSRNGCENAEVEIVINGKRILFTAMVDSGNLLREPFGGRPVIIVSSELFRGGVAEEVRRCRNSVETDDVKLKIRVIPQKTINGAGLLYGFIPDETRVNGKLKNAVVALDEAAEADYGGRSGVVPSCLCE